MSNTTKARNVELGPAEAGIMLNALEKYMMMLWHDPHYPAPEHKREGIATDCEMLIARILDTFGSDPRE